MTILTRPILEINTNYILDNYKYLSELASGAIAAAVVKDDAYGLGAEKVVDILYNKANCRHFFVAHSYEGAKVAPYCPDAKIYVLQGMGADSIDEFKQHKQLIPVINGKEGFNYWKENRLDNRTPIIHIETGLNRLGFREKDLHNLSEADRDEFSMIMSHLACGDEECHFMNQRQLDNFIRLKNTYFAKIPASLAASDGVFLGSDFHFDMVRLGAAMYGINTTPYRASRMKNVLTIKAPILQIETLPRGEYAGYSITYQAQTERKIAIVSIGYGDGLPRSLSNKGRVIINNKECPIIGRVSMENIICDVSDVETTQVGDMAYICNNQYNLDDMAQDSTTIAYELMSNIGKNQRFIRKYI